MNIKTTININRIIFDKVSEFSKEFCISKSNLVSLILNEMVKNNPKKISLFKPVRYQNRSDKDNWKCLHISLRDDLYEKAIDFRKSLKLSVSFLFSIAFYKYLQKIIKRLQNDDESDNYCSQYIFFAKIEDGMYTYTVYHNMPDEETLQKHLE